MAEYSSPPNSPSYIKNKRILTEANKYVIESPQTNFDGTTENIHRAMSGYGLKPIPSNGSAIDSDDPANQDVILFYWSSAKHDICKGSKCHEMHQVILQTEQLVWGWQKVNLPIHETCHLSPKCAIWEYSDFNVRKFQEANMTNSILLVPHMFQNRLKDQIPSTRASSKDRDIDAALLGSITNRRKKSIENTFQTLLFSMDTIILSHLRILFTKIKRIIPPMNMRMQRFVWLYIPIQAMLLVNITVSLRYPDLAVFW